MEKSASRAAVFVAMIIIPLLFPKSEADARSQIINITCDQQLENNQTQFIPNFVRTMELLGSQMRSSHNGTASVGLEPNRNYGLAQCYGDLSSLDCILCYAEARTVLPSCFPNNGGRIYLDGCFVRVQNYSFYDEITGPNDFTVCGNATRTSGLFQGSVRQALANAVTDASSNGGFFAREEVAASVNESVYVLADCWRTLSPGLCRRCLESASESILKCLPWSEGRAMNAGCIMRYSNMNFLNPVPVPGGSSNRGNNLFY